MSRVHYYVIFHYGNQGTQEEWVSFDERPGPASGRGDTDSLLREALEERFDNWDIGLKRMDYWEVDKLPLDLVSGRAERLKSRIAEMSEELEKIEGGLASGEYVDIPESERDHRPAGRRTDGSEAARRLNVVLDRHCCGDVARVLRALHDAHVLVDYEVMSGWSHGWRIVPEGLQDQVLRVAADLGDDERESMIDPSQD